MINEQELLKLKKDVESAKTNISELTGQEKAVLKQFKDEFQCNNIEEMDIIMKQTQDNIAIIDQKIVTGTKEFETKYQV
jgi:hypothetical protein